MTNEEIGKSSQHQLKLIVIISILYISQQRGSDFLKCHQVNQALMFKDIQYLHPSTSLDF